MKFEIRNSKSEAPRVYRDGGRKRSRTEMSARRKQRFADCCVGMLCLVLTFHLTAVGQTNKAPANPETPSPENPRELFNAGTRELVAGNFREAEAFLSRVLVSQQISMQAPALYNLGHVRFEDGAKELEKSKSGRQSALRGQNSAQNAERASEIIDEAIRSGNMSAMVSAYVRGRGAYRDLKKAIKAVEEAMVKHGSVLSKWQRAHGDFLGAQELESANTNAQYNADIVDRAIAKLIDEQQMMQMASNMMGQQQQELGDKLKQLGGMIPDEMMPPGAPGDEEEDGDFPHGPKPGMVEGKAREGEELPLSPEEAGRLLDGFSLEGERRLPMGTGEQTESTPRSSGRTW